MKTVFGHVLMGQYSAKSTGNMVVSHVLTTKPDDSNLKAIVQRFWELEEPIPMKSQLDQYCEDHFKATHYRTTEGRYVVSLPFKSLPVQIGPSKERAYCRLQHLEAKLSRDPWLCTEYNHFLSEYLQLGHMSKAKQEGRHYIPHHAVVRTLGETRKLRVVFDGSAKTSKGSLNDHLLPGPKLQSDICTVVLNFRRHAIVFITDIVKMFRQILIHPDDISFLHILWRESPTMPPTDFELNTITYGLNCSPYLSLRTILQLIHDEGHMYPLAVKVLLEGRYVDDISGGASDVESALEVQSQLIDLLRKGGFELSKWASNNSEILKAAGETQNVEQVEVTSNDQEYGIKMLGLFWNPCEDFLSFKVDAKPVPFTKRGILSAVARTFDPLGYVAPSIFLAKCIMQQTWKSQKPDSANSYLGWDDPLPKDIETAWCDFINDLPNLSKVNIPRYILNECECSYSIVGFCDASLKGYGAVIYLIVQRDHNFQSFLLKAKSRLAPIKTISIPRLELCGAVTLARLYSSLADFLCHFPVSTSTFFSDSSIVLSWLVTNPDSLKTFVSHRVTEIMSFTDSSSWRHVSSSDNPADILSRGALPSELITNELWWYGPSWLKVPIERWPISLAKTLFCDLPEVKQTKVSLLTTKQESLSDIIKWMERFSSYPKLIRSLAYVLRFAKKRRPLNLVIDAAEFRHANSSCVSLLQHHFMPELLLNDKKSASDLQRRLNTFIDPHGLIRVGGRIRNSDCSYSSKHPLLLPRRCHFNNILVDWYHQIHQHAGPATLQAFIQQTYWIPAARNLVKARKKNCLTCFKLSAKSCTTYMGDLPPDRFNSSKPFHVTAVDFAGPFLCKTSDRRNAASVKAYLCLFVCCSTKALHLELVPSLSTREFINTLEKFVARRGLPATILSDCGSNFKGTDNYLKEVAQLLNDADTRNQLVAYAAPKGINWKFNAPRAPHMGGLWESGVKVTKTLLKRTFGNHPYTVRELDVILAKIECILNSRPLYPLSSDPDDLQSLTPAHFLIGEPLTSFPEIPLESETTNRLNRWQFLRKQTQEFWRRWRTEYLYTLQQRVKWLNKSPNLAIGHLVLLQEDNVPPLHWPLGRVVNVYPGKDGVVRVVSIKTAAGTYRRPTIKVVSLTHLQENMQSSSE